VSLGGDPGREVFEFGEWRGRSNATEVKSLFAGGKPDELGERMDGLRPPGVAAERRPRIAKYGDRAV
jgi:hypothetical protein